jgi:ABC-type dipeptide/oligopeptide/nickel transport system permease component
LWIQPLFSYFKQAVFTLLGISFIMFSLTMLSTDDLAKQLITGSEDIIVSQEQIDAVKKELGLDRPFSGSVRQLAFSCGPGRFWLFLYGEKTGY